MLYLVGFSIMAVALVGVHLAKRAVDRGSAPAWLRSLVLGNAAALAATVALATGFGLLLQTAASQGEASGYLIAGVAALLPLAGLRLLARRDAPQAISAEDADLPPTTGGLLRRARPGVRPSEATGAAAGLRRAG